MKTKDGTLEILAPAGSMESLRAAVRSGADAVYLGADRFSARDNAKNFDREQLRQAVEYCHLAGAAVHLAVNTLLFEEELPHALELVRYACSLPVDAVIVQDWGLFRLLRQAAPELPLHASTQMSIQSPAGAKALEEAGAARVVLARELSLPEIREIADGTNAEIEHFVHGALCMCVSGQCYFSAMLGGRSGNRGLCAQTCRLPFQSAGGTGHDLSLKDLSMITRLEELREAGVDSCKIEGRMKRPEYVAAATASCRYAADGETIPTELLQKLEAVFSRSGFTTGYPDGNRGREMFGTRTYEDVTGATGEVFSSLQQLYHKEMPRVPVSMEFTAKVGEPAVLTVSDGCSSVTARGAVTEMAQHRPMDPRRCEEQLKKTGGTVFYVKDYHAEIDPKGSLPISALNALRRDALELLGEKRRCHAKIAFTTPKEETGAHTAGARTLRAVFSRVDSADRIPDSAKDCEHVFVPLFTGDDVLQTLQDRGFSLGIDVPRGLFGREELLRERLSQVRQMGITHGRTGNIGGVPLLKEADMTIHGGFTLNVTNSSSLRFLTELGAADAELSCEMTLEKAARLGGCMKRGIVAYGHLPLMLTRNCPAANHPDKCKGCVNNGGDRPARVVDRRGVSFPVQCERKGGIQIFNSVPLLWSDKQSEIRNQDFLTLLFTVENSVETDEILTAYRQGKHLSIPFTRGLYRRGVE